MACAAFHTACQSCSRARGNFFIVEGQKDVETLRAHGFEATCNAGGASEWHKEFGEYLKGRVCILSRTMTTPDARMSRTWRAS